MPLCSAGLGTSRTSLKTPALGHLISAPWPAHTIGFRTASCNSQQLILKHCKTSSNCTSFDFSTTDSSTHIADLQNHGQHTWDLHNGTLQSVDNFYFKNHILQVSLDFITLVIFNSFLSLKIILWNGTCLISKEVV